jgi:hypothetical protein
MVSLNGYVRLAFFSFLENEVNEPFGSYSSCSCRAWEAHGWNGIRFKLVESVENFEDV